MSKSLRKQRILDLVKSGRLSSQEQLRSLLEEQGFLVTQSTLSRDIRELGLVKGSAGYHIPDVAYQAPAKHRPLQRAAVQYLLSCVAAQNLVVLRTAAGNAHSLAVVIDQSDLDGVLGTVAGDDTVVLIAKDSAIASHMAEKLLTLAAERER